MGIKRTTALHPTFHLYATVSREQTDRLQKSSEEDKTRLGVLCKDLSVKLMGYEAGLQWSVSMHCFQNKFADKTSMKRIMKQPPQCMSFTLTFPRLGKAFNYCKMIGSHARWWNDLALSGDFIPFHRVGNNARGVLPWWNYFLLSPLRFMQKVQFCWHTALINMYDILVNPH